MCRRTLSPCGQGVLQVAVAANGAPGVDGCDAIDPADITGNTVLKIVLDDERNEVRGMYSVDGGLTFIAFAGFDVAPPTVNVFESGPNAAITIYARGVPEPGTAALLIAAFFAVARRGAAHKSSR